MKERLLYKIKQQQQQQQQQRVVGWEVLVDSIRQGDKAQPSQAKPNQAS